MASLVVAILQVIAGWKGHRQAVVQREVHESDQHMQLQVQGVYMRVLFAHMKV